MVTLTSSTKVSNYFFTENIIQIKLVQSNDLWKWCARHWVHATFCFDILNSGKILREKRHQSEKYYRLKLLNKYLFSHERRIQLHCSDQNYFTGDKSIKFDRTFALVLKPNYFKKQCSSSSFLLT